MSDDLEARAAELWLAKSGWEANPNTRKWLAEIIAAIRAEAIEAAAQWLQNNGGRNNGLITDHGRHWNEAAFAIRAMNATEGEKRNGAWYEKQIRWAAKELLELNERGDDPVGCAHAIGQELLDTLANDEASQAASPQPAAHEGLREALMDAESQLEYLDGRFKTGTTPAVLARVRAALKDAPQ